MTILSVKKYMLPIKYKLPKKSPYLAEWKKKQSQPFFGWDFFYKETNCKGITGIKYNHRRYHYKIYQHQFSDRV